MTDTRVERTQRLILLLDKLYSFDTERGKKPEKRMKK
jgi:hypothetical protein